MICQDTEKNKFNYEFIGDNLVKVWNPNNSQSKAISHDEWMKDYVIVNKWESLSMNIDRKKIIDFIKERIFNLTLEYIDNYCDDHPARIKESREKSKEILNEIIMRKQDYESIMYDSDNDLDLNYEYEK